MTWFMSYRICTAQLMQSFDSLGQRVCTRYLTSVLRSTSSHNHPIPQVRSRRSGRLRFLNNTHTCPLGFASFCHPCPASRALLARQPRPSQERSTSGGEAMAQSMSRCSGSRHHISEREVCLPDCMFVLYF